MEKFWENNNNDDKKQTAKSLLMSVITDSNESRSTPPTGREASPWLGPLLTST